jgi:hypothetical protein
VFGRLDDAGHDEMLSAVATVIRGNGRKIFQLKLEMERIRLGARPQPTKLIKINYCLGTAMILS